MRDLSVIYHHMLLDLIYCLRLLVHILTTVVTHLRISIYHEIWSLSVDEGFRGS